MNNTVCNISDMKIVASGGIDFGRKVHSKREVATIIKERFSVFAELVEAILDDKSGICSLVVTGGSGIGKTYELKKRFDEAEKKTGLCYDVVGGKSTPTGLYIALYRNRWAGQILVLDDCNVTRDDEAVDMLKCALDTQKERWISNLTMSKDLKDLRIPQKFQFEGKVVFLSNINFMSEIARGTKIAPHLEALLGRSTFVDLRVHDVRTTLIHVENVVRASSMFTDLGLTLEHQELALKFLNDNVKDLIKLSIRSPREIAYIMARTEDWERVARVTQLKPTEIVWDAV